MTTTITYRCPDSNCFWWKTFRIVPGCRDHRVPKPPLETSSMLDVPSPQEARERLDHLWREHWDRDHTRRPEPKIETIL